MSLIIIALALIFGGFGGAFLHHEYRDIFEHKDKPAVSQAQVPERHITDVTVHVEEDDEVRKVQ